MSAHLDPTKKHDALLFIECFESNPNGDPDMGGRPRVDTETGHGLISDVSLKRKVRDMVTHAVNAGAVAADRNRIFVQKGISLNEQLEAAYAAEGLPISDKSVAEDVARGQQHMIENYFDVRMFGAVMSTGKASSGKTTGPITLGIARSLHPVSPNEMGITRVASTTEDKRDNASQMGSKTVVPYGLYVARVHYQPTRENKVTSTDLAVFWNALLSMFENTRSATRGDLHTRAIHVFTHDHPLGNAPAKRLFDSINVDFNGSGDTATGSDDYTITGPGQTPTSVTHQALYDADWAAVTPAA